MVSFSSALGVNLAVKTVVEVALNSDKAADPETAISL